MPDQPPLSAASVKPPASPPSGELASPPSAALSSVAASPPSVEAASPPSTVPAPSPPSTVAASPPSVTAASPPSMVAASPPSVEPASPASSPASEVLPEEVPEPVPDALPLVLPDVLPLVLPDVLPLVLPDPLPLVPEDEFELLLPQPTTGVHASAARTRSSLARIFRYRIRNLQATRVDPKRTIMKRARIRNVTSHVFRSRFWNVGRAIGRSVYFTSETLAPSFLRDSATAAMSCPSSPSSTDTRRRIR